LNKLKHKWVAQNLHIIFQQNLVFGACTTPQTGLKIVPSVQWRMMPGLLFGVRGVYTIGVNQSGVIFHRTFYDWASFLKIF
jgi:hypothetical protein